MMLVPQAGVRGGGVPKAGLGALPSAFGKEEGVLVEGKGGRYAGK